MNPPLRSAVDQFSVLYSLIDGVIDVIATDHAPHSPEEKADFYKAPNGVIGMETSFFRFIYRACCVGTYQSL